jgi:hypothetical protein
MSGTLELKILPHEFKNIAFYFTCNVIDNVQAKADWDGDYKWGKEDASELLVSAMDIARGLNDEQWAHFKQELLIRYKGIR